MSKAGAEEAVIYADIGEEKQSLLVSVKVIYSYVIFDQLVRKVEK